MSVPFTSGWHAVIGSLLFGVWRDSWRPELKVHICLVPPVRKNTAEPIHLVLRARGVTQDSNGFESHESFRYELVDNREEGTDLFLGINNFHDNRQVC